MVNREVEWAGECVGGFFWICMEPCCGFWLGLTGRGIVGREAEAGRARQIITLVPVMHLGIGITGAFCRGSGTGAGQSGREPNGRICVKVRSIMVKVISIEWSGGIISKSPTH